MVLPICIQVVLILLVLLAAAFDIRYRRIPNWLNLSGIMLGFSLNMLYFHLHGAVSAAEGMLFAMAVYLPLYLLRGMGAGDVKLMAAVGALVGPSHWVAILLATAFTGGAAGAAYAFTKGRFSETCCNLYFLVKDLAHLRAPHKTNPQLDFRHPASLRMPHGVVIAAASLAFLIVDVTNPKLLSNLLS